LTVPFYPEVSLAREWEQYDVTANFERWVGIEVKDQEYERLVHAGALVFDSSNILHTLAARRVSNGTELFRVEIEIQ
jgi:hypothetical protein